MEKNDRIITMNNVQGKQTHAWETESVMEKQREIQLELKAFMENECWQNIFKNHP